MLLKDSSAMRRTEDVSSIKSKSLSVVRQSEGYKFISDIIFVALGQVFMSLTGLVVLPALTKNYPSEIYGLWAQMLATIGFLNILTIKFESAAIRFLAAEEHVDSRRSAVGTMLWPILLVSGIILSLSLLFKHDLSTFLFTGSEFSDYVPLVTLWASMEALFIFLLTYQRARGRIKAFAFIRLTSSILRMLVIVLLATAAYSFYGIVVSVTVIQSIFAAGALILIIAELGVPKFKSTGLKKYLFYSIPLLPGQVLYWIINVSDRYFITHLIDISHTGIYSASYSLAGQLMLLSWPIGMVLFPVISKLWDQGEPLKVKNYLHYSMKLLLLLSLPACAGLFLLSQPLLGILSTSEFKAGGLLVLVLAVGVSFSGVFLINQYIIYLVKKTIWLSIITGAGAVINALINIALIPTMGIMGAAISTLVSYFVISVITYLWGRQYIAYKLDWIFIIKVLAATAIMTAILWFIDINGIPGILFVTIAGLLIYIATIYLLKVFSSEDRKVIGDIFSGLRSKFTKSDIN